MFDNRGFAVPLLTAGLMLGATAAQADPTLDDHFVGNLQTPYEIGSLTTIQYFDPRITGKLTSATLTIQTNQPSFLKVGLYEERLAVDGYRTVTLLSRLTNISALAGFLTYAVDTDTYLTAGTRYALHITDALFPTNQSIWYAGLGGPPRRVAEARGSERFTRSGFNLGFYTYVDPDLQPPVPPAAVPEPATWALFFLGFGVVGATARRRAAATARGQASRATSSSNSCSAVAVMRARKPSAAVIARSCQSLPS